MGRRTTIDQMTVENLNQDDFVPRAGLHIFTARGPRRVHRRGNFTNDYTDERLEYGAIGGGN